MKNVKVMVIGSLLFVLTLLFASGCGSSVSQAKADQVRYTKYNFHYTTEKGRILGSVANLTKLPDHKILPYGSAVQVKNWNKGFTLVDVQSGRQINVMSNRKFLAGKNLPTYLDLILSDEPVSYENLAEIDRKGISDGRPYPGMSKQGVMIAMGYPSPHRTPSPNSNTWFYWENRFAYYSVVFENDIVVSSGH